VTDTLPKPTPVNNSNQTSGQTSDKIGGQNLGLAGQATNDQSATTPGVSGVSLPPTSVSALSSMSANKLPDSDEPGKTDSQYITTPKPPGSTTSPISVTPPGSVTPSSPSISPGSVTPSDSSTIGAPTTKPLTTPFSSSANQQTTVLGAPLPQTIRGEAVPTGLSGIPNTTTTSTTSTMPTTPVTPTTGQSTFTPTPGSGTMGGMTSGGNIPKESPTMDKADKPKNKLAGGSKSPIMRFLPFIVLGAVVIGIIAFIFSRFMGGGSTSITDQTDSERPPARTEVPAEQTTITYWGLWEPNEIMQEVIADFEAENQSVKVNYVQQSSRDYRERLQAAIQAGTGPDIFRFHASWVPMLGSVLDPIPTSVQSATQFQNNFYPVVTEQLVLGGQYVGLPLMYDGLVLYVNEDILETADESPPRTWPELRSLAVKLTIRSASGVERGGLAIGNASNTEHFSDILATLILQNGGNFTQPNSAQTRDALLFYTNFMLRDRVWDETLPDSTVAFARGDVAMMFAPSWRAHEVRAINPNLKFSTYPLPQLSDNETITWATYWAEGINAQSNNKPTAAAFMSYLIKDETLQKFYSAASNFRSFGEPYPKISMAQELANDTVVSSVLEDAPYATSWYLNSFTHDNGINDQMIEYYRVAVESILAGQQIDQVLTTLNSGVSQVLRQYNVN
jgi:multiple sugar transport system substrate-binding protein